MSISRQAVFLLLTAAALVAWLLWSALRGPAPAAQSAPVVSAPVDTQPAVSAAQPVAYAPPAAVVTSAAANRGPAAAQRQQEPEPLSATELDHMHSRIEDGNSGLTAAINDYDADLGDTEARQRLVDSLAAGDQYRQDILRLAKTRSAQ